MTLSPLRGLFENKKKGPMGPFFTYIYYLCP